MKAGWQFSSRICRNYFQTAPSTPIVPIILLKGLVCVPEQRERMEEKAQAVRTELAFYCLFVSRAGTLWETAISRLSIFPACPVNQR